MLELLSMLLCAISLVSFIFIFVSLFFWCNERYCDYETGRPNEWTKPLIISILLTALCSYPAYVSNAAIELINAEAIITSVENFRDKYPKDYEKYLLEPETSAKYVEAGQTIERYKKLGVYDLAKKFIR